MLGSHGSGKPATVATRQPLKGQRPARVVRVRDLNLVCVMIRWVMAAVTVDLAANKVWCNQSPLCATCRSAFSMVLVSDVAFSCVGVTFRAKWFQKNISLSFSFRPSRVPEQYIAITDHHCPGLPCPHTLTRCSCHHSRRTKADAVHEGAFEESQMTKRKKIHEAGIGEMASTCVLLAICTSHHHLV